MRNFPLLAGGRLHVIRPADVLTEASQILLRRGVTGFIIPEVPVPQEKDIILTYWGITHAFYKKKGPDGVLYAYRVTRIQNGEATCLLARVMCKYLPVELNDLPIIFV